MNRFFTLFHVSDQANITIFTPRPVQNKRVWPNLPPVVWAVSGEMVHNYLFPRDCPRVCRMPGPQSSREEIAAFRDAGVYRAHIFIEEDWRAHLNAAVLYRYTLSADNFYPVDFNAGYYVSEQEERPVSIHTMYNLPALLEAAGVHLQYVPDLTPYQQENARSGFRFSHIRMKNKNAPRIQSA